MNKDIKDTGFYKFAEKFCEENNRNFDGSRFVFFHNNDKPFDSVDRIYALYLIDINSHLLDADMSDLNKCDNAYMLELMTTEEQEEFELVTRWAYENYEREGMEKFVAFFNLLDIAQKGKEAVLSDSYEDGGWFGAS